MKNDTLYKKLWDLSKEIKLLEGIVHHLEWDQETYMPPGSFLNRAEQIKTITGIIHQLKTGKDFKEALSKLIDLDDGNIKNNDLEEPQKASLKEWRRDYKKESMLPKKFVEDFAKLTSQSINVWRDAKQTNNFKDFAPFLSKIVTMCRQKADLIGYKEHPYDALLDGYEHDITTKEISSLFSLMYKDISKLLKKICIAKEIDDSYLNGQFDHTKQIEFGKLILNAMGYDMTKGRLDFSSHPFSSSSHPTDSRITTRIDSDSLMSNILVILHEGGHALYEMNLPIEKFGSPLGEAISLGMHESQSQWWESRIGQSKFFWKHFFPKLKQVFKESLKEISLDQFYRSINKVSPSFIRVEADEVTYPIHILLRFELEKELIEGSLSVLNLPEAWNEKMQSYLGITPKDLASGCLQDIHWSMGAFGYFPTYTLGNMYAAQLFTEFEKKYPDWGDKISKGHFTFINEWLNQSVWQHGRQFSSKELIKKVTGKKFTSAAYVDYLNNKYLDIYKLS